MDSTSGDIAAKIASVKRYYDELEAELSKNENGSVSFENERLRSCWRKQRESMLAACLNPNTTILLPTKFFI